LSRRRTVAARPLQELLELQDANGGDRIDHHRLCRYAPANLRPATAFHHWSTCASQSPHRSARRYC
jgi:hypothetical protein